MSASALPFDDIRALFALLPPASATCAADARTRNADLRKPVGGLGRLEDCVEWLAAWQGRSKPVIARPLVAIFAASHGVAARGVALAPPETTRARLDNFTAGGAAINQICVTYGLGLKVFELALEIPTGDITQGPALDEAACAATIAFGMEAIAGADLLCLGETAVGNQIVAAAIFCALHGGEAGDWIDRGADRDEAAIARDIAIVEAAIDLHRAHLGDPLEVLRRLGGREIAAIAGAILAARMERVPVILDSYVVAASAAVLHAIAPGSIDHCLAAQVTAASAHARALRRLGKAPLLALGLRIGEGCGAALAAGLLKAAVACHADMATR